MATSSDLTVLARKLFHSYIAPNLGTRGSTPNTAKDFVVTIWIALAILAVRLAYERVLLPRVRKSLEGARGPAAAKAAFQVMDNIWIAFFSGTLSVFAWYALGCRGALAAPTAPATFCPASSLPGAGTFTLTASSRSHPSHMPRSRNVTRMMHRPLTAQSKCEVRATLLAAPSPLRTQVRHRSPQRGLHALAPQRLLHRVARPPYHHRAAPVHDPCLRLLPVRAHRHGRGGGHEAQDGERPWHLGGLAGPSSVSGVFPRGPLCGGLN